jgi:hypothetical protein
MPFHNRIYTFIYPQLINCEHRLVYTQVQNFILGNKSSHPSLFVRNRPLPSVARWYIFEPKIPIWENFGRSCNGRCCYYTAILTIIQPNGIFYGHLVHFVVIWYILIRFGTLYREKTGNPGLFGELKQ